MRRNLAVSIQDFDEIGQHLYHPRYPDSRNDPKHVDDADNQNLAWAYPCRPRKQMENKWRLESDGDL
jgi:hypothetical protein